MFEACPEIELPASVAPTRMVVVDTEEEFDWTAGFDRESTKIDAIRKVHRLQGVFDDFGIGPVYVVDYAIASQKDGIQALKPLLQEGRALIGAHPHAWLNPPFSEVVTTWNSYQGNLPSALERDKLEILRDTIEASFGERPIIHKAGRYGVGLNTSQILSDLGFEIDISAVPAFDWSGDGGPDYSRLTQNMFWFGPENNLLGIPNTGGFIGALRGRGPALYAARRQESRFWYTFNRILSRARAVERIMLSPEGHSLDKMVRLTRDLLNQGFRVLTVSLHSPTVMPGGTPYTRNETDVQIFLEKCRKFFEFFFGELGGQTMTPVQLKELALAQTLVGARHLHEQKLSSAEPGRQRHPSQT